MAVIHFSDGGFDPKAWSQNGMYPQVLPKCNEDHNIASHFSIPDLLVKKSLPGNSMEGGCGCKDCPPLAVGDFITLIEIPAGHLAQVVAYDVHQEDATFEFDLEIRNLTDLTAAGTVVKAGLGGAKADGAEVVNVYQSKYAEAGCKGKDCLGGDITYGGRDHAMLGIVVKALATPAAGCAPGCNPVGKLGADFYIKFSQFR